MRAMMETGFDAVYLILVLTLGVKMVTWKNAPAQFRLFGVMAIVLGAGDAFHLVPRAVALCTTGLENFVTALGMGKWITSVTMTVFYVLLYLSLIHISDGIVQINPSAIIRPPILAG